MIRISRCAVYVMQKGRAGAAVFHLERRIGRLYMRLSDYDYWCLGWDTRGGALSLDFGYSGISFIWHGRRQ